MYLGTYYLGIYRNLKEKQKDIDNVNIIIIDIYIRSSYFNCKETVL